MTSVEQAADGRAFEVFDEPYAEGDGERLLARIYRPAASVPVPLIVEVHGGAWTSGDRTNNQVMAEALAERGIAVVSLDFRLAPRWPYPAAVADVNAGIRWCHANLDRLGGKADWLGILGTSSGAHQVLLNILRPDDPRYAGARAAGTAAVRYGIVCWPISDPLARYRMAIERGRARLVEAHDSFFGSTDIMAEANPQRVLEGGAGPGLPPLLIVQGGSDENVTPDMAARLQAAYRGAGGQADLLIYPNQPHMFITADIRSAAAREALDRIAAFILQRTRKRI